MTTIATQATATPISTALRLFNTAGRTTTEAASAGSRAIQMPSTVSVVRKIAMITPPRIRRRAMTRPRPGTTVPRTVNKAIFANENCGPESATLRRGREAGNSHFH